MGEWWNYKNERTKWEKELNESVVFKEGEKKIKNKLKSVGVLNKNKAGGWGRGGIIKMNKRNERRN